MPPRKDTTDDRDLSTQFAVFLEKVKNLETLASTTAQDVRLLRDANFIRTADFQTLIEKFQVSFATKGELAAVRQDLDGLMSDRSKVGWFIVLAVLGSVLGLVLMNKGLHF